MQPDEQTLDFFYAMQGKKASNDWQVIKGVANRAEDKSQITNLSEEPTHQQMIAQAFELKETKCHN